MLYPMLRKALPLAACSRASAPALLVILLNCMSDSKQCEIFLNDSTSYFCSAFQFSPSCTGGIQQFFSIGLCQSIRNSVNKTCMSKGIGSLCERYMCAGWRRHECHGLQCLASSQPAIRSRPRASQGAVSVASCPDRRVCDRSGQPVEGHLETWQCSLQVWLSVSSWRCQITFKRFE